MVAIEPVSGPPSGQWACIVTVRRDDAHVAAVRANLLTRSMAMLSNDRSSSGPVAARAFHRAIALMFLVAWLSLASQVDVLIGSRGLLPIRAFLDAVRERHLPFSEFPTLLRFWSTDTALHAGIAAGIACSLFALAGLVPRVCVALNTALYLSFVIACRTFMRFQWDSLLLEAGALAVFLPRERRATWIHFLFRVLIFKLYFESGIAKWQSMLHDWQSGAAMTLYYETAPLPTRLAWSTHHLPVWWHHLESWGTLAVELIVPFFVFGGRRMRLVAAFVFSAFQLGNIATANYGFFSYLSLLLSVFLLSDRDLKRAWLRLLRAVPPRVRRLRAPAWMRPRYLPRLRIARMAVATLYTAFYLSASAYDALVQFVANPHWQERLDRFDGIERRYREFRLVNSYHLFASITTLRIEPEFQTFDGDTWTPHDLRYKPGTPGRAPPFVAPHQPRVDFQLWFYGVSLTPPSQDIDASEYVRAAALRRIPTYVVTLLERLCRDPRAVQPLFDASLDPHPEAVRIAFWEYHFTTVAEREDGRGWWSRRYLGETQGVPCWRRGVTTQPD